MDSRDTDGTVFLVVEPWATEPAAEEACQLVAGDIFVIRVQVPDRRETIIAAHAIEEVIDEGEDSILAAGRPEGCVTNAVLLP